MNKNEINSPIDALTDKLPNPFHSKTGFCLAVLHSLIKIRCVLFLLLFCTSVRANERIVISEVRDTNLFLTEQGQRISLANVQTISIADPDSFRQQFAFEALKKVEKRLLNHSYVMEIKQHQDSLSLVHLWQPLPLGRQSINKEFLSKGWGSFVPLPPNNWTREYEKAAITAQAKKYGLHNPDRFKPVILPTAAIWIHGGLGIGVATDHRRSGHSNTDCFLLDTSLNIRRNWFVWTGGHAFSAPYGLGSVHQMRTWYMLAGKSFYGKHTEAVLSIGPNMNKWQYNTESERGTVTSNWLPGAHVKLQILAHLPVLMGFGLSFDMNLNKDISYYIVSLNLILGGWSE